MKRSRTRSSLSLVAVLGMLLALLPVTAASGQVASDLIITGVVDGPLSGGIPKVIEVLVVNDVADLSVYGLGSANNGGGSDGEEFSFPSDSASAGEYLCIASEATGFDSFFGFGPDYTTGAASINGDDAIELFLDGSVVDVFGDINVDGNGEPWEYLDGWASRLSATGPDGSTFVLASWTFSGPNALDGETSNATASSAFPINCEGPPVELVINEVMQNPAAVFDSAGEWFELYNPNATAVDIDGWTIRDDGSDSHVIFNEGPLVIPAFGFLVLGNNADLATNGGAAVDYSYNGSWFLSNSADEIVLLDTDLNEVDRVEYDGGPAFPDPNGASMAVIDSTSNNNSGGNWCQSGTPFGDGDMGSPGTANDCYVPVPTAYKIHEIQGSGAVSPLVGELVTIEGVVVGDFQGTAVDSQFTGFHVQEEDEDVDGDSMTSEGIFVFAPSVSDVSVGDVVTVVGTVSEFFGLTEIGSVVSVEIGGTGTASPATVGLPVIAQSDWEKYEGMLVTFPQGLFINEFFNFDRFGEVVLGASRQFQATNIEEPGSPAAAAITVANALARITLDDGQSAQNPVFTRHPAGGEFTLDHRFRGGDVIRDLTGVVDYAFGSYKIQPTQEAAYEAANPRTDAPEFAGATVRVAAFNVLNFFTHLDDGSNDICGPLGGSECRGADTADEYIRQRDKIVAGIIGLDADVVGLMEIENDVRDDEPGDFADPAHYPVIKLVEALNAAEATAGSGYVWDWDVANYYNNYPVRNEIIYRNTVTPLGAPVALQELAFDGVRPGGTGLGDEPVGRPPVAQSFADQNGEVFTVVANHFKSKGSSCETGVFDPVTEDLLWLDPDSTNGQANCPLTRVKQSEALMAWIATDPTGAEDTDVLIIGDLNSYAMEDPIGVIEADGYTNLLKRSEGAYAYTYVFDGQLGNLDHALGSASILSQVTGTAAWHINSDEPDILDYDMSFKKDVQDALYEPNAYRASDHDPVIVGLRLDTVDPEISVSVDPDYLWPPNHKYRTIAATVTASDNLGVVYWELVSVTSSEVDCCFDADDLPNDIVIVDDTSFELRAEGYLKPGRTYTMTYRAWDLAGNEAFATATVFVPHDQRNKKVRKS